MSASEPKKQAPDWSALIGGLAHELKNPLSTMNLNLQLLREDWTDESGALAARSVQKIDVLLQESERLERMLADFLRLTSSGDLDVGAEDINAIIQDVLGFTAPELRNRNIVVTSQLDRSLPRLALDENLMRQALLNLIKNAADAATGPGATITIQTHAREGEAVVDVIDTGMGMSEDTLKRAFSPYFSTKADGTGLGLPMVRRIIERHGGRVECASALGTGTKVSLHLPLPEASEEGGA